MKAPFLLFISLLWLVWSSPAFSADSCAIGSTPEEKSGFLELDGDTKRKLYWKVSPAKAFPKKGSVFFLAGGPIAHLLYAELVRAYQANAFPDRDFVLYDYYGINCSDPAQDIAVLPKLFPYFSMPQMARDFIALKKHLVGEAEKTILIGGSHGAMLGSQIIADFPGHIEKAILYSGDTKSGWLKDGWSRFDRILQSKNEQAMNFGRDLEALLHKAASGDLFVTINDQRIPVTREMVEVIIWLVTAQDSTAQAKLPATIRGTLDGDSEWLAEGVTIYYSLLSPVAQEEPPTYQTLVTNFHRCNVWMPKSARKTPDGANTKYLKFDSFFSYWNQLCAEYDSLGEFPLSASVSKPTNVPILTWMGDLDYFDPKANERNWRQLSSQVTYRFKPGWSHDFGPDPSRGFAEVLEMIKEFAR